MIDWNVVREKSMARKVLVDDWCPCTNVPESIVCDCDMDFAQQNLYLYYKDGVQTGSTDVLQRSIISPLFDVPSDIKTTEDMIAFEDKVIVELLASTHQKVNIPSWKEHGLYEDIGTMAESFRYVEQHRLRVQGVLCSPDLMCRLEAMENGPLVWGIEYALPLDSISSNTYYLITEPEFLGSVTSIVVENDVKKIGYTIHNPRGVVEVTIKDEQKEGVNA